MTQLDCSVTSCLYNQDHYCAKEDITVGGSNAKKASDTCCESFRGKNGSASNSVSQASSTVDIDCEASSCVHNRDCKCCAESIGIGGGSQACTCRETECADFCCR
ncbi:DUF1540 domain-containing protein [uncultured Eubacterium sp.]|uniref:DUF1540 domain-containing protein n=1 Tax=uncultured Eubacterium sp. TaxID=165185 RepID=UPI0025F96F81|nr:DUF1540 domain-containing protein [uncultured Eubacterium sp.]